MSPVQLPIGLRLAATGRSVSRAFGDALTRAGGSLPVWLVLLNLTIRPQASQRELAEAIGVSEATLTHHLNAMEAQGLLSRRRDPANRRIHIIELSDAGQATFQRLRDAARGFDRRLRDGLTDPDLDQFTQVLDRLARNADGEPPVPPWAAIAAPAPGQE